MPEKNRTLKTEDNPQAAELSKQLRLLQFQVEMAELQARLYEAKLRTKRAAMESAELGKKE